MLFESLRLVVIIFSIRKSFSKIHGIHCKERLKINNKQKEFTLSFSFFLIALIEFI